VFYVEDGRLRQPEGLPGGVSQRRRRSALTLSPEGSLLVSDQAHGSAGFEEALLRHHGKRPRPPQRPEWGPEPAFVAWHRREVFKGTARHLGA
jgi:putative restriction endonuclease